jgi:hypothetical protein
VSILRTKRAIFAGCARNCAEAIPYVLNNVSRIARLFAESAFVFVENDSRDSTKNEISAWCRRTPNARLISLDGLAASHPFRSPRVAISRNRYLSLVQSEFRDFDFLIALDCDEVNAAPIDLRAIERAIEFLSGEADCAGVFGNSDGIYYDLWALRHPTLCPGDIWEEVCDYALAHGVADDEAFAQTFAKRLFSVPRDAPPLEVDSAFGGLGIYKVPSILKNRRHHIGHEMKLMAEGSGPQPDENAARELAWQRCEHVSFHRGFRERGERLFIVPDLINCRAGEANFSPSFWRTLRFDPRLMPDRPYESQAVAASGKIGRNQPCPCGSGKKYKHCHGALA